jgi:hypothetical protein
MIIDRFLTETQSLRIPRPEGFSVVLKGTSSLANAVAYALNLRRTSAITMVAAPAGVIPGWETVAPPWIAEIHAPYYYQEILPIGTFIMNNSIPDPDNPCLQYTPIVLCRNIRNIIGDTQPGFLTIDLIGSALQRLGTNITDRPLSVDRQRQIFVSKIIQARGQEAKMDPYMVIYKMVAAHELHHIKNAMQAGGHTPDPRTDETDTHLFGYATADDPAMAILWDLPRVIQMIVEANLYSPSLPEHLSYYHPSFSGKVAAVIQALHHLGYPCEEYQEASDFTAAVAKLIGLSSRENIIMAKALEEQRRILGY